MSKDVDCDVCVIGAGAAGLTVAGGAARFGLRTILFERDRMGGDCLNYGCVPSKALLAAAHRAQSARDGARFGVHAKLEVDFPAAMAHVRSAIAAIAPHDSAERFESWGVKIIKADARFTGAREVRGGGYAVRAKRIVIAAGSRPALPAILGLPETPHLTNENIFFLEQRPAHLLILGGGPIGVEMAQAFRRLGSEVTLFERGEILPKDDADARALVRARLRTDGVALRENVEVMRAAAEAAGVTLTLRAAGERISGSHLLVAAGRAPSVEGLALEAAGVAFDDKGIRVDAHMRTSNRRVYAIGDIAQGPRFTHVASYHARIVLKNALFRIPAKVNYDALPWVTYTEPELAQVGLNEAEARKRYGGAVRVIRPEFSDNDRAVAEGTEEGFMKVVTRGDGRILGVTLVGPHAGELIHAWALAIAQKRKLSAFNDLILPYPTLGEISQAAANDYYLPKLFTRWPRRLARLMLSLG